MRMTSLLIGAAMLGACTEPSLTAEFTPPERFDNVGQNGESGLIGGRIDGRLGRFDVETDELYGYVGRAGRRHLMADLRGRDNGVLMAFLELQNVRPSELEVGDRIEGGMEQLEGMMDGTEPGVFMYACAGEVDDEWEEDVPADDVDVEVEEKNEEEGTITLGFDARLMNGQSVRGSFTVQLNDNDESADPAAP